MTDPGADRYAEYGNRDPDALIRRAGRQGDPDRDQHFLVDDRVVDRIPGYLPPDVDRGHLLEIGGGPGVLTDRLLAIADHVTVIERDESFVEHLESEFAAAIADDRLTVVAGDATEVSFPADVTACVSNLPYGVSSPVAFRLFPRGWPLVVMFQREFAQRMVAAPGEDDYGRLSVSAQHYADVEIVETVPRTAFDPQPAVDSAIVRAIPRTPAYEVGDESFFLRFVKAVFTQRRKTMRNAIRNTAHISGLADPEAVIEAAPEAVLRTRPGKASPETLAELANLAIEHGSPELE